MDNKNLRGMPDDKSQERTFHRPFSMRVEGIGPVPQVKQFPAETEITINLHYSREIAKEMIDYLENELSKSWLAVISVEVVGPSP